MKKIIFLAVFAFLFLGCKSKLKTRELGAYTYKTSAVSIIDSKLLVNAYGQGQTKKECLNNATINALRDVIFKGISDYPGSAHRLFWCEYGGGFSIAGSCYPTLYLCCSFKRRQAGPGDGSLAKSEHTNPVNSRQP